MIAASCIEKLSYVIKDCSRKAHTFRKWEILIVNYVIHWRILQNISGNVWNSSKDNCCVTVCLFQLLLYSVGQNGALEAQM